MSEAAHSALGPSSADRWINCPGSVRYTSKLADEDSKFSAEGSAAHTVSEWCRHRNCSASSFLGQEIHSRHTKHVIIVDEEMVEGVDAFVEYVENLPGQALIEARVRYASYVPGGFGTLDDGRLNDGTCYITDFKYGKGVQVFAKENSQLKLYALGVYLEYSYLYDIKEFVLCIFQPRLDHIDKWTISIRDLLAWAANVARPAALEALSLEAKFRAGDWCTKGFCKVRNTCTTRASKVIRDIAGEFEDLDVVADAIDSGYVPLPSEQCATIIEGAPFLGNTQAANLLQKVVPFAKAWCKDLEHYALSELAKGNAFGDYKLVAGRSKRQWCLDVDAMKTLWKQYGLAADTLFDVKVKTVPKVEKLLGKKHELLAVRGLIDKQPGKPTLAPGSDPRPALTNIEEFSVLGEEGDDANDSED